MAPFFYWPRGCPGLPVQPSAFRPRNRAAVPVGAWSKIRPHCRGL